MAMAVAVAMAAAIFKEEDTAEGRLHPYRPPPLLLPATMHRITILHRRPLILLLGGTACK